MFGLVALMGAAFAGVVTVHPGEIPRISVPTDRPLTLALPAAVRLTTGTRGFVVEAVERPAPVQGNAKSEPVDVLHLALQAEPGAASEQLTVELVDGRHVTLLLDAVPGSLDTYATVQFPDERPVEVGDGFLGPDLALWNSMVRDSARRREYLDEVVVYDEYPELQWHLVRRYRGDEGLLGYVYVLTNLTGRPLQLNESVLSVGSPNRATLVQLDHHTLEACRKSEVDCQTTLRVVVASTDAMGPLERAPAFSSRPDGLPFVSGNRGQR